MGFIKSAGAVGLEIDTGIIRVVELKGTSRSFSLTAFGQIEIPESAVVEGVVADAQVVAQACKDLWEKLGISRKEVVLGISNQGVFMRLATFPKIPEKKLAQALGYQAGEYFPIPLPQLVYDFAVLGELTGDRGAELEILYMAARRDLLEKSLEALNIAGLQPRVLDVSYLALLRTLPKHHLTGTVVLVDMANGLTTLQLINEGIPRFARVIPHSLMYYARDLNLTLPQLFTALAQVAAAKEEAMAGDIPADSFDRWVMILEEEIRSTVNYYVAQGNAGVVDTVVLSGCGARIVGLATKLMEDLGVQVEILNPFVSIKGLIEAQDDGIETKEPDFAVSIGLALRGLGA